MKVTTTNKILAVVSGQVCSTIMAIVGAIVHDPTLTATGGSILSGLTLYLIGNGRSAAQGETAAPAIVPKPED